MKGNRPARKSLVIAQPASQPGRVQRQDTGEAGWEGGIKTREEDEEIQVSAKVGVFERCPGRQTYAERQTAVCVYCANLAQMRHSGECCLYNKQGHVQFSFHNGRQSHAEHVDIRKTLPGRRAATVFFFLFQTKRCCPGCQAFMQAVR